MQLGDSLEMELNVKILRWDCWENEYCIGFLLLL